MGALNVSQSDSALAVHSHSLAVSTVIVPEPPADVTLDVLTFSVTAHRCADRSLGDRRVVDEELQAVANAMRMSNEEYRNRTPPKLVITAGGNTGRQRASEICQQFRSQEDLCVYD